jgi:hypothetical protein
MDDRHARRHESTHRRYVQPCGTSSVLASFRASSAANPRMYAVAERPAARARRDNRSTSRAMPSAFVAGSCRQNSTSLTMTLPHAIGTGATQIRTKRASQSNAVARAFGHRKLPPRQRCSNTHPLHRNRGRGVVSRRTPGRTGETARRDVLFLFIKAGGTKGADRPLPRFRTIQVRPKDLASALSQAERAVKPTDCGARRLEDPT